MRYDLCGLSKCKFYIYIYIIYIYIYIYRYCISSALRMGRFNMHLGTNTACTKHPLLHDERHLSTKEKLLCFCGITGKQHLHFLQKIQKLALSGLSKFLSFISSNVLWVSAFSVNQQTMKAWNECLFRDKRAGHILKCPQFACSLDWCPIQKTHNGSNAQSSTVIPDLSTLTHLFCQISLCCYCHFILNASQGTDQSNVHHRMR